MNWWRLVTVTVLILLAAGSLSKPAAGSDYTILLGGDHFKVTWSINVMQNLTALSHTIVFPQNLNSTVTGNDLSAFTSALQSAFRAKVPTTGITQPTLSISSNTINATCSTSCRMQWLNTTIAFQVNDNPTRNGGVAQYDLSWKAIRLEENLQTNNIAFNTLGQTYLLQPLAAFFPNPRPGRTFFITVGGIPVTKTNYQDRVGKIVLLDMSGLQTPLGDWIHTQDLAARTETWVSPDHGGFNITASQQITESDFSATFYYYAAARVSAKLSTPLNAFARGDTLFVDYSNGLWEQVGSSIVIALLAILIITTVFERRITSGLRERRRRRNR